MLCEYVQQCAGFQETVYFYVYIPRATDRHSVVSLTHHLRAYHILRRTVHTYHFFVRITAIVSSPDDTNKYRTHSAAKRRNAKIVGCTNQVRRVATR